MSPIAPAVLLLWAACFSMAWGEAPGAKAPGPPVSASISRQPPGDPDASDVLGANTACLVCHLTFVKEPLARSHQLKGISCTKCHGASVGHANDEHIGVTRPDVTYPRDKVDVACAACHKQHDVPAAKVIGRFLERKLPARPIAICTDCHGTHRIEKAGSPPAEQSAPPLQGAATRTP